MRFLALALVLLAWPATAIADMRATWRGLHDGSRWTAEVADNGDARFEQDGQEFYMLRSGGETHAVYTAISGGLRVVRVRDLERIMAERGIGPLEQVRLAGTLVRRGEVVVGGQRGQAYYLQTEAGLVTQRPAFVVSRDPAIARLGELLGEQLDFSIATIRIGGRAPPGNLVLMRRLMEGGVPLLFGGYSLEMVETAPIAAERFRMPAPAMTIEALRRQNGPPPPAAQ